MSEQVACCYVHTYILSWEREGKSDDSFGRPCLCHVCYLPHDKTWYWSVTSSYHTKVSLLPFHRRDYHCKLEMKWTSAMLLKQEKRTAPQPLLSRLSEPGTWPSCSWSPRPLHSGPDLRPATAKPWSKPHTAYWHVGEKTEGTGKKSRRDSSNCLRAFYKHREGKQKKADNGILYRYASSSPTTLH